MIFGAADEEAYRPQNFDKRSRGVVRLRTALASSLNVPAVYTLSRLGLPLFLGTLRDLGFSLPSDAAARYGLGTAIGNAEVSLLDLVHAFSVFPRGGTLADLSLVEHGPRDPVAEVRRIFDPFAAWIVCSILSDPSARATGFGIRTYFRTSVPSMFKSGTSSEFTNLWCVGATPRYTVGVWAGNFDGRAVINKTGSIVPTQVASDILEKLSEAHPLPPADRDFRPPPAWWLPGCARSPASAPRLFVTPPAWSISETDRKSRRRATSTRARSIGTTSWWTRCSITASRCGFFFR